MRVIQSRNFYLAPSWLTLDAVSLNIKPSNDNNPIQTDKESNMAFKLDKQEAKEWHQWVANIGTARDDLNAAVDEYNIAMEEVRAPLLDAVAKYNQMISELVAWCEDIGSVYGGMYEEKGDKWKDSDKGQAVSEWVDQWTTFNPSEADPEIPEDIDIDDLDDAAQMLADLQIEVE